MKRLLVGLLIGLAVGLPAGAAGWWLYSEPSGPNAAANKQLAGEVAFAWLDRKCPFCEMAGFERLEDDGWRLTVADDGARRCYRMEIDPFNLDGLKSVAPTPCADAGWTYYVPLTP